MPNVVKLTPAVEREDSLERIYRRQRRQLRDLGLIVPPENELFTLDSPLEAKVAFYAWLIGKATAA